MNCDYECYTIKLTRILYYVFYYFIILFFMAIPSTRLYYFSDPQHVDNL